MSETTDRPERPDLKPLCQEWRDRLGLSEWEVLIRYGRQTEDILHNEEMWFAGRNNIVRSRLLSQITVLDPVDWQDDTRELNDVEKTVVHELLHCLFDAFSPEKGTEQHVQFEIAINLLSRAFVGLKRRENAPDSQ